MNARRISEEPRRNANCAYLRATPLGAVLHPPADGGKQTASRPPGSTQRRARFSIGSSMSSIQFYQAIKDDILLPRNKKIPETFKSAMDLLVGDRGGFVFKPRVGIHDCIGELDFSSMYPSLMSKYNISAETVLCKCCPDSPIHIPGRKLSYLHKKRRHGAKNRSTCPK